MSSRPRKRQFKKWSALVYEHSRASRRTERRGLRPGLPDWDSTPLAVGRAGLPALLLQ